MAADFPANPFRPGPGQAPPVLAGRENVQKTLLKAVHESREQGVAEVRSSGRAEGEWQDGADGMARRPVGDRMDAVWLSSTTLDRKRSWREA